MCADNLMARSEISIILRVLFEFTPVSIHPESGMVKHENEYISINASYDNHWCLVATHPNNKVCGKYDLCVCFIVSKSL